MKRGFYTIMSAQFFSSLADNALFVAAVQLLRSSGSDEWQQAALIPMFALFYVVLAPFVGAVADALLKERAALESGLGEPLWRDPITWSLTQATESPPWLVDALIALVRETLGRAPDPATGESSDEPLPMPVPVVLARICDLDPAARERVCLDLRSFPQALFAIATARYETGPHLVPVMPSMSASVVDVLEAELAPRLERQDSGQRNAILAFARLPNATSERSARLLEIVPPAVLPGETD